MSTTQAPHIALLHPRPDGPLDAVPPGSFVMLAKHKLRKSRSSFSQPTVSTAELDHISSFLHHNPEIHHLELQLTPSSREADSAPVDPFFLQFHLINQSIHLLRPLLSSSSLPFSAMFVDFVLVAKTAPIAKDLHLPIYVVSTTSVEFFSLMAYFPVLAEPGEYNNASTKSRIKGCQRWMSHLPPTLLDSTIFFCRPLS
ncbi:hypothetical protein NL676_008167 [Syzygium grande]|nr:hypothetical protein NL676_008167 [Syzygium grande]